MAEAAPRPDVTLAGGRHLSSATRTLVHSQSWGPTPGPLLRSCDERSGFGLDRVVAKAFPLLVSPCQNLSESPWKGNLCVWQAAACIPGRDAPQTFSSPLQALAGLFHPPYRLQWPLRASLLPTLHFLFALEHWKSFPSRAPSFSSFSYFFLFSSIKDKKNVFTFILHASLNTC